MTPKPDLSQSDNPDTETSFTPLDLESPAEIDLTATDLDLIRLQLDHQEAETDEERLDFKHAYTEAKKIAHTQDLTGVNDGEVADLILDFAKQIFPQKNQSGLRNFWPRHKKTGELIGSKPGTALEGDIIEWCMLFATHTGSADELFYRFENIHPFDDGNGRVGHLMWAIDQMRRTAQWPQTLPPDFEALKPLYDKKITGYEQDHQN